MPTRLLPLLFVLLLFGCYDQSARQENAGWSDFSSEKMSFEEDQATAGEADDAPIERQIIRTADYRIQVADVGASAARIEETVKKHGGYISSQELNNSSYELNTHFVIRVPNQQLDSLLEAVGREATFTNYRRVTSTDVTEEFVDIQIRLKTKKEVRDRYIEILRNQAKTVEDILRAEEQIRVVQEEIEAKEGRLKYLQNQVSLSTLNLNTYQRIPYQPEPDLYKESFGSKVKRKFLAGWDLFIDLLLLIVNLWPLILIGAIIVWQRKRIAGLFRRRKKT